MIRDVPDGGRDRDEEGSREVAEGNREVEDGTHKRTEEEGRTGETKAVAATLVEVDRY